MPENPLHVDPSNADQAREWDGSDGEHWASFHTEYERLLGVFDTTLLTAASVRAEDRCLDIGCGTGATTRALAARAASGSVLGVDLSGPMLAVAREAARRLNLSNVAFVHGDAQVHQFEPASFDVAVSRMGCMFFGDPEAAFANVGRALRPGGRVALTMWQEPGANRWITAIDEAIEVPSDDAEADSTGDEATGYVPGPFSFADGALCASLLERAGFDDVNVEALEVPLPFGSIQEARSFVEAWIDGDLDHTARSQATDALQRLLIEHDSSDGVRLQSATWLVTARRA